MEWSSFRAKAKLLLQQEALAADLEGQNASGAADFEGGAALHA